jgi:lysozyme family protein
MSDADFYAVMPLIFRDEGGYSDDPNDAGNWTGGAVWRGALLGTNFGISAAAYPSLDIKNLTQTEAQGIYYSDYWDKFHFDYLPSPFNAKAFDIGINCGPQTSIKILQQALQCLGYSVVTDGIIGPNTEAAVKHANESILWETYVAYIENHYEDIVHANPKDQQYLQGWLARAQEIMP